MGMGGVIHWIHKNYTVEHLAKGEKLITTFYSWLNRKKIKVTMIFVEKSTE